MLVVKGSNFQSQRPRRCVTAGRSDCDDMRGTDLIGFASGHSVACSLEGSRGRGRGERLRCDVGLLRKGAQLGLRVREEADAARARGAVLAQLCAVARRVQPVLKHIVRVRAGIPSRALARLNSITP